MQLPSHLNEREDEIVAKVTADLERRNLLADTDHDLIRQYASAVVEARRLTDEVRKYDAASQEFRRISIARDRAQRNASSLATKLKITARSRATEKPEKATGSIYDALHAEGIISAERRDEYLSIVRSVSHDD